MSKLDDVTYVDKLQIQTASGETSPSIFANGRNQIAIQVIIKAATKDDKPLKSVDELSQGLFLCFADDGSKLNWNGKNGWTYTNVQGEYNGETQGPSNVGPTTPTVADDGTVIFKWFVSSTNVETRRISVGLRTSTKLFTTADNASGAEKSSVSIEAGSPIDYNERNNIEIKLGGFETLESNLRWYSDYGTDDENQHDNGISTKRMAYINPASQTRQTKFKKFSIDYTPVDTSELIDGETEPFIGLSENTREDWRPCAIIGRSQGNQNFQLLMAYSRQNHVKFEGYATANNSDQLFNFEIPLIDDNNLGVDEHGIPSLLLYQFSYPVGVKITLYKWKSVAHQPTVNLTDFYGNQGSIRLVFNDGDNFDGPGIF